MWVLHRANARSCSGIGVGREATGARVPERRRADRGLDRRLTAKEIAHRLRPGRPHDDVLGIGLERGGGRDPLARQEPLPIDPVADERRVQPRKRPCVRDPAGRGHDRARERRVVRQLTERRDPRRDGKSGVVVLGRRRGCIGRTGGTGSNSRSASRAAADSGMPNQSESMPSGAQTSSARIRSIGRPSARRIELADEPAERQRVVAGLRARLPGGRRVLEDRAHPVPVDDVLGSQVDRQVGETGLVGKGVAGGDPAPCRGPRRRARRPRSGRRSRAGRAPRAGARWSP